MTIAEPTPASPQSLMMSGTTLAGATMTARSTVRPEALSDGKQGSPSISSYFGLTRVIGP